MPENRKLKVFLCHSKDDKPKVRELYRRLVADGFDAWLDEEKLMPGQDWDLEIRKAVRETDVVIVCLSYGSVTKAGYVQKEIRFALDVADEQPEGAVFIIPARLEDCQVPTRIDKWQWVNLFEKNGVEKLKQSLKFRAKGLSITLASSYEPQMICVPAGNFLMGSTEQQVQILIKDGAERGWLEFEYHQHKVELSEYYIGQYPVTNYQYRTFVRETDFKPPQGWNGSNYPQGKDNHPVVNVSWDNAIVYCNWLSRKTNKLYRLPTEAEWEKAARGMDNRIWSWGDEFNEKNANTAEANIDDTTPVGYFSPQGDSIYGCADMIGNVWEWCADWFDQNEYKSRVGIEITDPQGPQKGNSRVQRGGSFGYNRKVARCSARFRDLPNGFGRYLGFRIALSS